ncbi:MULTISPECIES: hypothetical protein [unclassified Brachybacterium]|uniref:hypothetical protein n=1 Tax=unclassified Brachybacterium TaxID=2623841 RepID=UPI004034363D
MTVRRSQDPSAQEHDENASSAAEHWTPQRREAAIPARRERALPRESPSTDETDEADETDAGDAYREPGTRGRTCDDSATGRTSDQITGK